ncbi:hypothetical protein Tco_0769793 [Tanacetum coccineum]|uniref:Uncharacterized protein n=1 Tax=Tanacetum coccineum TaxID=301880 RepID=A0ABQ4ZDB4_9ASTR
MIQMLKSFDKEDLETLWKLVKAKHGYTRPEEGYERVLWGDLKTMFKHNIEDTLWRNLLGNKVLIWKLFDSCGVHFVRFQDMHIFMLVEKRYPLTPAIITQMLNRKLQTDHCNEICYQLLKLMTKQLKKHDAESLVYIRKSAAKTKDKEEFDEEERQRIARVHEAARSFSETKEREKYSEDDQSKMLVDLINQRKRYFAAQKAEAKRNKPMTQAQQRTYMSNYIKHMGNYKLQQLKRLSFNEIKDLFETTMRRANTFVPMETKIRRGVIELVADSSKAAVTESAEAGGTKRAAEEELGHQSSKKQKSDDLSQEEL